MLRTIPTLPQLDELADMLMEQTLASWRIPVFSEQKADGSLVTAIDRTANHTARKWARKYDIGFIGEEGADANIDKYEYVLYVDPLDGTSTYLAGKPEWSVVLTLMKRVDDVWRPEACIIGEPVSGRKYYATRRGVQERTLRDTVPRPLPNLRDHTGPYHVSVITWRGVPFGLGQVRNAVETHPKLHHHGCGNTGINGPLIALGHMHGVVYAGRAATESAAITLMVTAAGGVVTDLFGEPLSTFALTEIDGKLEFALPRGMIAASSPEVAMLLAKLVHPHQ